MARSLDIDTLMQARHDYFVAIAWERWATRENLDPSHPYPDGVEPSAALREGLEELETRWVQETPPAPATPEPVPLS